MSKGTAHQSTATAASGTCANTQAAYEAA